MKKKLLAIILSCGLILGSVPAYAAIPTGDTVPTSQYGEAVLNLYTESYAYMLRAYSDNLLMAISFAPATSEFSTKEDILTSINNINYYISLLENINTLITEKHIEIFYNIQPYVSTLISNAKIYVDCYTKIYNGDSNGYSISVSALPAIYDSQIIISQYCDSINTLIMQYLANTTN